MSNRFRQVPHARPSDEIAERDIRRFAKGLRDQQDLEKLLDGADDQMRAAMIERLKPYISFDIFDVSPTPDCPNCGMKRGAILPHACAADTYDLVAQIAEI